MVRTGTADVECVAEARRSIAAGGLPLLAVRVALLDGVTGSGAEELRAMSSAGLADDSVMASMLINSYRSARRLPKPDITTEACDDKPMFRSRVVLVDASGRVEGAWCTGHTRPDARQRAYVSLVHAMTERRLHMMSGRRTGTADSPTPEGASDQQPARKLWTRPSTTEAVPLPGDSDFASEFQRRFRNPHKHLMEATFLRGISGVLEMSQLVQLLFETAHPQWLPAKLAAIAGLTQAPIRLRQLLNAYSNGHGLPGVEFTETTRDGRRVGEGRLELSTGEVARVSAASAAANDVRHRCFVELIACVADFPDAMARTAQLRATGLTRLDGQTALQTLQRLEILDGRAALCDPDFTLNADETWSCQLHGELEGEPVGATGVDSTKTSAREQAARLLLLAGNKRICDRSEFRSVGATHQPTPAADEKRQVASEQVTRQTPQPQAPRGFTERQPTRGIGRLAALGLLSNGADLVFDPYFGEIGTLLCLEPTDTRQELPDKSTYRQFLWPGGELRTARCWPVNILVLLEDLASHEPRRWSASASIWSQATRHALQIIRDGRVLPHITDLGDGKKYIPTWRAMATADDSPYSEILGGIRLLPMATGAEDVVRPPLDLVTGYIDMVVDAFMPSMARYAVHGPAPFVAHIITHEPITPLQDWVDEVDEFAADLSQVPIVLRLGAPDMESQTVTARLFLTDDEGQEFEARESWQLEGLRRQNSERLHHRCRRTLRRAAALLPALQPLADTTLPDAVLLSLYDVATLRSDLSPDIQRHGLRIEWTDDWVEQIAVTVDVILPSAFREADHRLGLSDVFDRRWRFTLDGEELTDGELRRLASATLPCVRLRNRWMVLTPDLLDKVCEPIVPVDEDQGRSALDALGGFIWIDGIRYACTPTVGLAKLVKTLRDAMTAPPSTRSRSHPQLDLYQHQAVQWLEALGENGLSGLLADEAGTGKTPTAIAFHLSPRRRGHNRPTLVLVPNAANIDQWISELRQFAPQELVYRFGPVVRRAFTRRMVGRCVLVTTYATMRKNAQRFASLNWGLVIADEAQTIKNPKTKVWRCAANLPTDLRLALSGTPLENGPCDLHALLDWCNPRLMGRYATFRKYVVDPALAAADPSHEVLAVVRPFIMRRLKSDPALALGLPDLVTTRHLVDMTSEQRGMHQAMMFDTADEIRTAKVPAGRLVLKAITALRKIANAAAHFADDRPDEILADPAKAVVRTPKLAKLAELLQATATDECVVVYTSFLKAALLVAAFLEGTGHATALYHGKMSRQQRAATLQRVADGEVKVLLMTLQSGGIGLNITRPSQVIHFDVHPNPAVEDQGNSRVHRRGQTRPVHVHKLISVGSIEQRLDELQGQKRHIASLLVPNASGQWPGELTVQPFQLLNSMSGELLDA
ncbi:superfamily II DNA or RNA helicase [Kribbella aluminosa]|uniref:Superfamily II DNA or RNA helicase n=1 Tax=Kribbella aluminosa TaxID=416017 RepID=A0ABS4UX22_9ACTN|nr:superfamily II DNA or RNA helicase [Kribbella aluminosa]